jgi:hypothetical protein
VSGLVRDARYHAWKAGFRGAGQTTVVAIAMAESGLDPAAINTNTDGSVDRGILQINSRWHPEVTDACAFDPACAFRAAFAISHQGADFSPWSTYQSGAYRAHLAAAAGQQASPNLLVTADPATGARRVESWDLAWSWAKGPIVHLHRKRSILT